METKPDRKQVVDATIEWCNERRAEKGMEAITDLPKGYRTDAFSCPCGTATGLSVGRHFYTDLNEPSLGGTLLPELVSRFTAMFDHGQFPEYDADLERRERKCMSF